MYDLLQGEALLPHVRSAVGNLETGEVECYEADRCREVLDQLVLPLLPLSELDEAKRVVSAAVTKMLIDCGGLLSLDDIESIAHRLNEYDSDQDAAGAVAQKSLRAFISEIDSTLSEISSLDELDDFERGLKRLMGEYGLVDSRVDRDISYRRESLLEREEHYDEEGYGRSPSPSQPEFSGDQIRSMFQGLLGG